MRLTPVEHFALQMLFHGADTASIMLRVQLDTSEVVMRKATGVGFFASIHLTNPLPNTVQRQWDWNFEHRHLSHGGSFMCWLEDSNVIELEAVTHNGDWPDRFDPNDFTEAR